MAVSQNDGNPVGIAETRAARERTASGNTSGRWWHNSGGFMESMVHFHEYPLTFNHEHPLTFNLPPVRTVHQRLLRRCFCSSSMPCFWAGRWVFVCASGFMVHPVFIFCLAKNPGFDGEVLLHHWEKWSSRRHTSYSKHFWWPVAKHVTKSEFWRPNLAFVKTEVLPIPPTLFCKLGERLQLIVTTIFLGGNPFATVQRCPTLAMLPL